MLFAVLQHLVNIKQSTENSFSLTSISAMCRFSYTNFRSRAGIQASPLFCKLLRFVGYRYYSLVASGLSTATLMPFLIAEIRLAFSSTTMYVYVYVYMP